MTREVDDAPVLRGVLQGDQESLVSTSTVGKGYRRRDRDCRADVMQADYRRQDSDHSDLHSSLRRYAASGLFRGIAALLRNEERDFSNF